MKTDAVIQTTPGGQLTIDELEVPDPRGNQVLVKLFSSGICHYQLHQVENPKPKLAASYCDMLGVPQYC